MAVWKIEGWDGTRRMFELVVPDVPARQDRSTIIRILKGLVCRDLSPQEIVEASIARNHKQYNALLEPVSYADGSFQFGHGNHHYIATLRPTG
jgi:hypothetical protein